MSRYIVRIGYDYEWAQRTFFSVGSRTQPLRKQFALENCADDFFERFTYETLTLEAPDAENAKEVVGKAFLAAFPDAPAPSLIACPYVAGDGAVLMNSILRNYYGAEEYQELMAEFFTLIPALKEKNALPVLRQQCYLFAVDDGCGFTTLLSSMSNFFQRTGLYEGSDVRTKYIEYKMNTEDTPDTMTIDDVISALDEAGEKPDVAAVGLNIAVFLEEGKIDGLRDLCRRLERFEERYVFVFRVPFIEKKALDRVIDLLSDLVTLRVVQIPPLPAAAMMETAWDLADIYDFQMRASEFPAFESQIAREKKDGRFYGFKTVGKIVRREILRKTAQNLKPGVQESEKTVLFTGLPEQKKEKTGYDALAELVGMEQIAQRVREITAQVKIAMANEKLDRPCIHMRFLGAPGTGKTTVARIIGQIFREEGILRKGGFMEYSARQLCAEYVGQTAVKTAGICRDAYGSVLFLDEAYALYDGEHNTNDFGKEALTTLISEMENHRDDMLVIMAGYTDDMETLMEGNAGLRSRMPYAITFPNYTRKQLFEIYMQMVGKHFEYTPDLEKAARAYFDDLSDAFIGSREFSNARFVRNLYERTWSKAALRVSLSGKTAITLCKQDFISACAEKEFSEKLSKTKAKIGF